MQRFPAISRITVDGRNDMERSLIQAMTNICAIREVCAGCYLLPKSEIDDRYVYLHITVQMIVEWKK